MNESLERRWDRNHLTIKDWISIIALVGGLIANYVAIDRRLTRVETKVDILYDNIRK